MKGIFSMALEGGRGEGQRCRYVPELLFKIKCQRFRNFSFLLCSPWQAGNEADVTLYLSATGLMWENAPDFRALLVFAEHRFYGESLPFGAPDKGREFLR